MAFISKASLGVSNFMLEMIEAFFFISSGCLILFFIAHLCGYSEELVRIVLAILETPIVITNYLFESYGHESFVLPKQQQPKSMWEKSQQKLIAFLEIPFTITYYLFGPPPEPEQLQSTWEKVQQYMSTVRKLTEELPSSYDELSSYDGRELPKDVARNNV